MPLETPKDIARYFQVHSVSVRPEAARTLIEHLSKIKFNEQKQRYLDKFLSLLKDLQKVSFQANTLVLDSDTTESICNSTQLREFDPAISH